MQSNPLDIRLQDLIAGWKGDQRGEPLSTLHILCKDAAGGDHALLPRSVYLVKDLDSTTLQDALKRTSAQVRFQAAPHGRFDAALVPVGSADGRGRLDRFILAVEQTLSLADQVALYAHAFGHLLLNYQARLLENRLNLNPDNGMTHYDRLSELRYVEKIRSKADRDVLESFPKLAALVEPQPESTAQVVAATQNAVTRLRGRGWSKFLVTPYEFTAGRVLPGSTQRGRKRSVDVLMQASSSLPLAALHSQRTDEAYLEAVLRLQDAAERLMVPFAYLLELDGTVHEFDYKEGDEPVHTICADLPTHEELLERWLSFLQVSADREILTVPYYQSPQGKRPRYYQDAAINRALIAVLQARQGLREKRVLLVLATGTGKTHIAFQLLWKLKQKRVVRNVLFLADRTYLLNQAQIGDFAPLNDRIWMAGGDSKTSRDIVLASYQWLTRMQDGSGHYHDYPADYFDLIIVDECHRGSASEDSLWRDVLIYFSQAVQVGLTATPLESKVVQTSEYFGPAVYTYPLSRGINDGFLAPYRVRRVLLGQAALEEEDGSSPAEAPEPGQATSTLAEALVMETRAKMRQYTQAIAEHLANYLQQTDPRARTIVFCVDNEHAAQMRASLQAASASWARAGDIVRIVVDDQQEGKRDLSNFCSVEEKQPVVVTTSKLLSTGIDAPTCKNIVLARAVGSMVEFKQIIGRGTRLFGKEKTWFTILDYAGAIKHFFDPNFDGNPESIINEPLTPQTSTENTTGEPEEQPARDEAGPRASAETVPTDEPGMPQSMNRLLRPVETPELQADQEQAEGAQAVLFADEEALEDEGEAEDTALEETQTPAYAFDIAEHETVEQPYQAGSPGALPTQEHMLVKEQREPESYETNRQATSPNVSTSSTSGAGATSALSGASAKKLVDKASTPPPPPRVVAQREDGTRIVVQGEMWFELGADGRRLRDQSQTLQDWAKLTLRNLVQTPQELGERWLDPLQRLELIDSLKDQIVAPDVLAREMDLENFDPFDVLLQAVFGTPALTRTERVARLRQQHATRFARFEQDHLASRIIDAILSWYINTPIPWDKPHTFTINDVGLLKVQPIASVGAYPQLVLALKGKESSVSVVLQELQRLLYTV